VVETGAGHIDQAQAVIAALYPVEPKPASTATYTIASGPERARAGHQRRRAWDFA